MRALVHGTDGEIEAALGARGVELARSGHADVFLTIAPAVQLHRLADISPGSWRARFQALVEEPFWAFQAWLRDILQRGAAGRWIAITSVLGVQPFPSGGADGTAAVALHTLARIAALEYGPRGLRANAVAAGWRAGDAPAALDLELAARDTPTQRLTTGEDIAAAVHWLLGDAAGQLNGEVIRLDGGYTITRGSRPDPFQP